MSLEKQSDHSRTMWLCALICIPLVLSVADAVRDVYCDMVMIRTVALRSEVGQLRSSAIRQAGRLEALLEVHAPIDEAGYPLDWESLAKQPWLKNYWKAVASPEPHQVYSAVLSNAGIIVLHTRGNVVGQRLSSTWDDHKVPEVGGDVVRVDEGTHLTTAAAYDVHVPLVADGRHLGTYHVGLDAKWFDGDIAAQQREFLSSRSWVLGFLALATVGAFVGLFLLFSDLSALRRRLSKEIQDRSRQLAQIGMGLAHEIRNPLHTLRINLHTLRRSLGRAPLKEEALQEMVRESDSEIERVDALVRDLVQYATPQAGELEDVDLAREILATLNLLGQELRRSQVQVQTRTAENSIVVHIEPARLRQVALQLLTFAQRSAGPQGTVEIEISERNGRAELMIADSGPALSGGELARLFEPFQGTSHTLGGLSLALVRKYVEDAGGKIDRRRHSATGSCFVVSLPMVAHSSQGA